MAGVVNEELGSIDAYLLKKLGASQCLQGLLVLTLAQRAERLDIFRGELRVLTDLRGDLEEEFGQISWQGQQGREKEPFLGVRKVFFKHLSLT